jgi:hypothetical protein
VYFGDFELLTGSASMLLPFVCEVEAVVGEPSASASPQASAAASIVPSPSPRPVPSVSCLAGWTPYADVGGLEGQNSCLRLFNVSKSATDAAAACSAFPSGHLVTVLEGLGLGGFAFAMINEVVSAWVGASHNASAGSRFSGWSWVDGTPSANQIFNCGGPGCGVWAPDEPRQVPRCCLLPTAVLACTMSWKL